MQFEERSARRNCSKNCQLLPGVVVGVGLFFLGLLVNSAHGQALFQEQLKDKALHKSHLQFLGGRQVFGGGSPARALHLARSQHKAMVEAQRASPAVSSFSATWQPLGPVALQNPYYGPVSGRVTSLVIDPSDASGNTVYLGSTGGGVWKSTNAAGVSGSVSFVSLTDSLTAFSSGAGNAATASLSIGALAIGGGVLLAGTGDPNDASDSYYGGGILRSADGGQTWTYITDSVGGATANWSFVGSSVSGLAFSTLNPSTAVAGFSLSAEGVFVNAGSSQYQLRGLFYSNDSGRTWQASTVLDGSQKEQDPQNGSAGNGGFGVSSVVWNPVRRAFYAAISGHGYYQSPDGVTWSRLTVQPGSGISLVNCPTTSPYSSSCPLFRGTLAVQPASGDLFALTVNAQDVDQGLYQDVCAAANGTCANAAVQFAMKLNSEALEVGGGNTEILQGGYNLALAAVSSGSDTTLYVGTVDLYRCSIAGGCVLRNTTNAENGCSTPAGVAPSQHTIAADGQLVYLGGDGGIWRSVDGVNEVGGVCAPGDASHFQNLNLGFGPNGSLGEVVSFAQDAVSAGTLLAGFGALGSAGTGTDAGAWAQMSTGEGGSVAIDPTNSGDWYVSTGAGVNIARCSKGASCSLVDFSTTEIGAAQVDEDTALVHAPWLLDPGDSAQLLLGTCRIWRGPSLVAGSWAASDFLSPVFEQSGASGCGSQAVAGLVRAVAVGGQVSLAGTSPELGSEVVYAGMAGTLDGGGAVGGHVFATLTAGAANGWFDASASPVTNDTSDNKVFNPAGFDISSVFVDQHDPTGETVYLTVMGFPGNGLYVPHVYRSVNGGLSWLDISADLPAAPANSVVVDPNDANTVYVAMDTGVYVTTTVSACSSGNCWNVYGTGLPKSPVVQLLSAVGIATGDGRTGVLRAATYGRGIWSIPLLTATSPLQPAMSVSPNSLAFGSQQVGTLSSSQTVTVANSGTAPLTVSRVGLTGDFGEADTCTNANVMAGGTCAVSVWFSPSQLGARSGQLTIFGNVVGGQATVSLAGTGTAAPIVVLNPMTVTFGTTLIGTTSASQNVTVSNTAVVSASIQAVNIASSFTVTSNSCGLSLPPSTGCTVSVAFKPTATGTTSGTLSVVDSAGTQTAALTGTGAAAATDALAPLSLSFAPQQQGTTSAAQQVILTNSGDQALTLISASTTGQFAVLNGCGASLSGHSSCTLSITYTPTSQGSAAGTLVVSDVLRSQTVSLSGIGLAPPGVSLSPSVSVSFAATPVGQASAPQLITVTNSGGVILAISGIVASGDFAGSGSTCGLTLAAGSSCSLNVTFTPTQAGSRQGTLTLTDNASSSPQALALSGVGVDFQLAPDGTASQTVRSGVTATYLLLLSSTQGVPGTATFTCSGIPVHSVCTVSPTSPPLFTSGGTVVTVAIATGDSSGAVLFPQVRGDSQGIWLAGVFPLMLLLHRRRRTRLACIGLLLGAVAGCSTVGRTIPSGGGGGGTTVTTPSGTYQITVAGSGDGLVRSVNLTLIVQ
jgi:hypothetical protein